MVEFVYHYSTGFTKWDIGSRFCWHSELGQMDILPRRRLECHVLNVKHGHVGSFSCDKHGIDVNTSDRLWNDKDLDLR
jgi:hypothetical protein